MTAAACILAISLIVSGIAILAQAFGLVTLPDDVWGAIILVLGTAGKFITDNRKKKKPAKKRTRKKAATKTTTAASIVFLLGVGCAGTEASRQAQQWAACAGTKSLTCIPSAGYDSLEQSAISFAACLAKQSIDCAGQLLQPNPPTSEGPIEECILATGRICLSVSRNAAKGGSIDDAEDCIVSHLAQCYGEGVDDE